MQIANRLIFSPISRLPENINRPSLPQPIYPVESPHFLWESAELLPRNQPQVRQSVHEELHGQSHKQ